MLQKKFCNKKKLVNKLKPSRMKSEPKKKKKKKISILRNL